MAIFSSVKGSRAWAEVDLEALAHNLALLRAAVGEGVATLLVAKADAYGHGALEVARRAVFEGVEGLAVATVDEALELRRGGIRARILVLGAAFEDEAAEAIRSGVEFGVPSVGLGLAVERTARSAGAAARIHVKVDTGMNRLGTTADEALALLRIARASRWLRVAGVMTHVASTTGDSPAARAQLRRFDALLLRARSEGLVPAPGQEAAGTPRAWVHALNSASVLSGLRPRYDAVRPGIAAYGIAPDVALPPQLGGRDLAPVLSVRTRVIQVKEIPPGSRVGYGGTWEARRPTRLATVPIGYDDGVDWRLGGRGEVLVRGRRVPIVGRISMDYTTLDVTDVGGVGLGDVVTLIGRDGGELIRVEELARRIGTIPYEVVCSIGKRVHRRAVGSDATPRRHGPPRPGEHLAPAG